LGTKSSPPERAALVLSCVESRAVRKSTGTRLPLFFSSFRMCWQAVRPSMRGIITSRRMASGDSALKASTASSPSAAVATTKPRRVSWVERISRIEGSSSATRILRRSVMS
jgi:hypothetical protein